MIFESVRGTEFPTAVSRLDCAFAHEGLAVARRWLGEGDRLFEVRPIGRVHRGDIGWTSRGANGNDFRDGERVAENARRYWGGQPYPDHDAPGVYVEILASGGLLLGKEVTVRMDP